VIPLRQAVHNIMKKLVEERYLENFRDRFLSSLEKDILIRVKWDKEIFFVGDLHGDFTSLLRIYENFVGENSLTIFLGDYVDRGFYQLETFLGILLLKTMYRNNVILLRGNHESLLMNKYYGFINTLKSYYYDRWIKIYKNLVIPVYLSLPIAIEINVNGTKFFGVHGGIPINIPTLEEIDNLPRQLDPDNPILLQLLWNDPREYVEEYDFNPRGEGIYYFGRNILERFLAKNGLNYVIRAHEPVDGYKSMFNGLLHIVFTCRYYGIRPKILKIENRKISIIKI